MISQSIWTQLWDQLAHVFQELAEQMKQSIPHAAITMGHSSNAVFPFRAYATYTVARDRPSVDVSVDCKLSGDLLLISADVAKENGLVLSEFSGGQLSVHASSAATELVETFSEVEAYLKQQLELICSELM